MRIRSIELFERCACHIILIDDISSVSMCDETMRDTSAHITITMKSGNKLSLCTDNKDIANRVYTQFFRILQDLEHGDHFKITCYDVY